MGPHSVRPVAESTVTLDRDGITISVSHDKTKVPRLAGDAEPPVGLHKAMGQPDPKVLQTGEESSRLRPTQ